MDTDLKFMPGNIPSHTSLACLTTEAKQINKFDIRPKIDNQKFYTVIYVFWWARP